jgi:hypothetical protein
MGIPPKETMPMPLTDASIKQSLIFCLQILRDHDAHIDQVQVSLQALVNVLAERSPEFRSLYAEEVRRLEQGMHAFAPGGARSIADSIDGMLRLIQDQ